MKDVTLSKDYTTTAVRTINRVVVQGGTNLERTDEGMLWNGQAAFYNETAPARVPELRAAVAGVQLIPFDKLDTMSNALFGADYADVTVVQSRMALGAVIKGEIVQAVTDSGVVVDDLDDLVTEIVQAIAG